MVDGGPILIAAGRSTTIDFASDDSFAASVNPDEDQLTVIVPNSGGAAQDSLGQKVLFTAGSQPVSVSVAPDKTSAYVVMRHAQQLVRVLGLNSGTAQTATVDLTFGSSGGVAVGSEPTGVALTPHGTIAVVANYGEQTVSVVNTQTGAVQTLDLSGVTLNAHPRAVAISNTIADSFGNIVDNAQQAYVTLFFGQSDGVPADEVLDSARTGVVVQIDLGAATDGTTPSISGVSYLGAISPTGILDSAGHATGCSPNQLYGAAINPATNELYVPTICASPAPPIFSKTNVFGEIGVIGFDAFGNLSGEDTTASGSALLETLVDAQGRPNSSLLLGDPVAIAFRPAGSIGYIVSRADNAVQRIVYESATASTPIVLGIPGTPSPFFSQIPLTGAATPIGITVSQTNAVFRAYVTNWTSRSISVIDISQNPPAWVMNLSTSTVPGAGTAAGQALAGKKFFYTGVGGDTDIQFPFRWSTQGISSCASCHPDGKSDGMTWVFAAGPRQTLPLDGTFSKVDAGDQRALNWTANLDEIHDFENNTRGTQGGEGAIVTTIALGDGGTEEVRISLTIGLTLDAGFVGGLPELGAIDGGLTRNDNLSGSAHNVNDIFPSTQAADWDDINIWVQGLKSNAAPTTLDPTKVTAGRTVFEQASCNTCHAGDKWTASTVPYTPSAAKNGSAAFVIADGGNSTPTGLRTEAFSSGIPEFNTDTLKVSVEKNGFPDGGGTIGPERITCVLRNVGTFSFANAWELNAAGNLAQGNLGFNPPTLLGLATTGPYLHDGEVTDLHNLFNNATYGTHLNAGNAAFFGHGGWSSTCAEPDGGISTSSSDGDCVEVDDLVQFLLSIDGTTATEPPLANADVCGAY